MIDKLFKVHMDSFIYKTELILYNKQASFNISVEPLICSINCIIGHLLICKTSRTVSGSLDIC